MRDPITATHERSPNREPNLFNKPSSLTRRSFLKSAVQVGAALVAPQVVPSSVLALDGTVSPSERTLLGAIGIGNRGSYVLSCFLHYPDVQFVAVCDVKAQRRTAVKNIADAKYGN